MTAQIPPRVLARAIDVHATMREEYHDQEGAIPPDITNEELYGFLLQKGVEAMEHKYLMTTRPQFSPN